jgi:hypothetical protein
VQDPTAAGQAGAAEAGQQAAEQDSPQATGAGSKADVQAAADVSKG